MKNCIFLAFSNLKNKFTSLSKLKKAALLILLGGSIAFSFPTSYVYGNKLCNYFLYIGAVDKAPAAFYLVYTLNALLCNLTSYNALIVKEEDKQDRHGSFTLMVSKLIPLYLYNLALAFLLIFLPYLAYSSHTSAGAFKLIIVVFLIIFSPFIPLALATPFALLFKKVKRIKLLKYVYFLLLTAFLVLIAVFESKISEQIFNNAYTLATVFTKYYFPAAFFEAYVTYNSFLGLFVFVLTNVSAFYLSIVSLIKINELK